MQKELLDQLETPCIVIDMARAEENVIRMQAEADAAGCRLRPHIKTHKMPLFTRMQMAHMLVGTVMTSTTGTRIGISISAIIQQGRMCSASQEGPFTI